MLKLRIKSSYFIVIALSLATMAATAQTSACTVTQILHNPNPPVLYSPDSSKYLVNKKDTAGIYQIYVGNAGDTNTTCISLNGPFAILRPWPVRHKMQVQWHPSGNWIVCAVEKEYYNELILNGTPQGKDLLEGWLESGLWMDIYAVTPDGAHWYELANTIHGFTGPAFTPDGTKGAWAEAQDSSNLQVNTFGNWKLMLSNFTGDSTGASFTGTTDITPTGARWIEPGNFAPDGKSLVVSSDVGLINAEGQDQYIIDITNGQLTHLNNTPMVWDEHGVFSPDGKKILFMSSYPYQADTNSYHTLSIKTEFMLMNIDGSDLQQLTHFRDTGYFESSPGIAATGFFSKDGSIIYAQSLIFPLYDNWIIQFAGNCGNEITSSVNEEEPEIGFSIFPNPAGTVINMQLNDSQSGNYKVEIMNLFGELVFEKMFNANERTSLSLANFSSGTYLVRLSNHEQVMIGKFVKQ